jgi:glutamate-1-semialdehyde 2,1-aminomutase
MSSQFEKSMSWLQRAESTIPLGSQTFSKSRMALPLGASPLFLAKGKGATVTDIDNNSYTDFVNGLLCVSLGYQDEAVDNAISEQLKNGISFSLPHMLETEVAELLVELIPCAEMVRFGKNGSDVTSAAIRLARAYTKKDHIAVCGYHGWQDWYIGSTTRDLGVPKSTKEMTHVFTYNDIASLEKIIREADGQLAAVIMEPLNITPPTDNFLHKVRALCDAHNIVLVFDEIITGFRYHLGGAQAYFGVTPDLATFGKGMANGMPISAIVGKKNIMMLMNDIFFSGTFGGETLSLAAAKATIEKMRHVNYCEHLWQLGDYLIQQFNHHFANNDLFSIKGLAPWSFLVINNGKHATANEIKSWLVQELCKRGILFIGTHNLSYSHTKQDIDKLIACYVELFATAHTLDQQGDLVNHLDGKQIESVFKVR